LIGRLVFLEPKLEVRKSDGQVSKFRIMALDAKRTFVRHRIDGVTSVLLQ